MGCSYLLPTSDFIGLADYMFRCGLSKTNNDVLHRLLVSIMAAAQASLLSSLVLELACGINQ